MSGVAGGGSRSPGGGAGRHAHPGPSDSGGGPGPRAAGRAAITLHVNSDRVIATRDPLIFGHFLEHFHRQIYGGVYDPGNPLSDKEGFRTDVIDALRRIGTPVIRWPGGCFVSAYHWKHGVGPERTASFDKAWRVEEPNTFGTDEFIALCRKVDAEPYICTNAGNGTPEEMSDWVEYCNLAGEGQWAKLRRRNGHDAAHAVRYWSIGNENYLPSEIGSKTRSEWARYVRESAKMMKRVDPSIELSVASTEDLDWNIELLRTCGDMLDWISVHGYWDMLHKVNNVSDFAQCMEYSRQIDVCLDRVRHILGALGYLGRLRVAFDEWNLRGWHHPAVDTGLTTAEYLDPRNENDDNSVYTMADAIFSACFLNSCLRNADMVGMANFAPSVNTRGAIFTHPDGIVLRTTFHVFEMFTKYTGERVVDSWLSPSEGDGGAGLPRGSGGDSLDEDLDIVATAGDGDRLAVVIVNRSPDRDIALSLRAEGKSFSDPQVVTLAGDSPDSFNDVDRPENAVPQTHPATLDGSGSIRMSIPAHSVSILSCRTE